MTGETVPGIETTDLRKEYGQTVAVDDLSLCVPAGSVYGFLGPNGAGKTTTMRMLATLLPPTAGQARIAGVSLSQREQVLPKLGYLPEEPPIHDELTGREQLRYVARLREIPASTASERTERLLEQVGLQTAADDRIETYSTGMRKKLGLVQTLLHDPAVVLLDEPTSGLDPRAVRAVRKALRELAERDVTVFLSSHSLSVVDKIADRVGVLDEGRLVAEGTPVALKERVEAGESTLEAAFMQLTDGTVTDRVSEERI